MAQVQLHYLTDYKTIAAIMISVCATHGLTASLSVKLYPPHRAKQARQNIFTSTSRSIGRALVSVSLVAAEQFK